MFFILLIVLAGIGYHCKILLSESNENHQGKEADFLRPDVRHFVFYSFACTFLSSLFVLSLLFAGVQIFAQKASQPGPVVSWNYLWMIMSVISIFSYVPRFVQFKKEKYFFYDDRLIQKGGGIFNDFERELSVQNITHVTMMIPFLESKLFQTGNIRIESAGSAASEICLQAIGSVEEVYTQVTELMKNNGFKLTQEKLVQEAAPNSLAVFFEVFGIFSGVIFGLVYAGAAILEDDKINIHDLIANHGVFVFGGVGVFLLLAFVFCGFTFLDLKKRMYYLYEDTIAYSEGFLNKNYSFIPIENLSDSSVTQSIPSRIFGLFDVKISCQGSGQEILFKNMEEGEALSKNIDKLVSSHKTSQIQKKEQAQNLNAEASSASRPVARSLDGDREYIDEFKMSKKRVWMPLVIFSPILIIFFPVGIIAVIMVSIAISANTFRIKSDTVEHVYDFLHKKAKEFSFDKVTSVIVKKSFFDKWCNSISILFWSIGSGENICLSNISNEEGLVEKILAKKGIRKQDALYELKSTYDLFSMISGNLYGFITAFILLLSSVLFLPSGHQLMPLFAFGGIFVCIFIYRIFYYNNSEIIFYEDYIHFRKGIFFVTDYYSSYNDIKDISTVKFPFLNTGNIKFNVGGETIVQTQQGAHRTSNSFKICFVDDIHILDELIDMVFHKRPTLVEIKEIQSKIKDTSMEPELCAKPALINSLFFLVPFVAIIDVAIFLGAHILPYSIPSAFIAGGIFIFSSLVIGIPAVLIKATSYNIQSYRVYERSGIVFKRQDSITNSKIDFINFSQGPLNKMFGNGNITINTTGSSKPELIIKNIKEFKKFYELLKSRYQ